MVNELKLKYQELREQLRAMDIPLPQDETEFESLCVEVGLRQPKGFLEIGSRDGGSLWMLAQFCAPGVDVVCIDSPGGKWGRDNSGQNLKRVVVNLEKEVESVNSVNVLLGDSHSYLVQHRFCNLLADIDFLFIDADHSFGGVLEDWKFYHRFVSDGGLVAFHDILENPKQPRIKVHLLWRVLKTIFENQEFTYHPTGAMGIGVIELQYPGAATDESR